VASLNSPIQILPFYPGYKYQSLSEENLTPSDFRFISRLVVDATLPKSDQVVPILGIKYVLMTLKCGHFGLKPVGKKLPTTKRELYEKPDQPALRPLLPSQRYPFVEWKTTTGGRPPPPQTEPPSPPVQRAVYSI